MPHASLHYLVKCLCANTSSHSRDECSKLPCKTQSFETVAEKIFI